jgi:hypothetical protein
MPCFLISGDIGITGERSWGMHACHSLACTCMLDHLDRGPCAESSLDDMVKIL